MMVRLIPHRIDFDNHNTPVLYDREIDTYAHAVLAEYKPQLLYEPGALNFQHFLESYLDATIEFHDICGDDPERPILAMTVFKGGKVRVFDRENECISHVYVSARTVIIDNAVMKPGKEGFALFTGLHECGHIMMHWDVFLRIIEDEPGIEDGLAPLVCCRRESTETPARHNADRDAAGWREHQADYFAAALAMPNATFKPFVYGILRDNGYYRNSVTLGSDEDLDILADDIIPDAIAEVYGVSGRAARIKLRKTGLVYSSASRN